MGGEAIQEIENDGDAVKVDAQLGTQPGDGDETPETGGVETQLRAGPLGWLDQAELDESLDQDRVDEQLIFYCPVNEAAFWYFSDSRTYRTGRVAEDYLISGLERLL